ncbi:phage minor tail protein L, partial [Vibrio owensii]|uniref:phage minor tail protein L n=1 Tax=Vibrio owensii TaxID=696485 RepID=UPI0040687FDC
LYELQLTAAVNGIDTTFFYHAGTNELLGDVVFNGLTYQAVPVEVEGFDMTGKGAIPRPTFRIANANSSISALLALYNPLQGKVTRIRTCKKFLDAVNFSEGNATAD